MYKLTKNGVQRLSDTAFIPANDSNKDWQEYLIWLSKGNTPQAKDPEPVIEKDFQTQINELKTQISKLEVK